MPALDIIEHGAGRVGGIRHVARAAGQVPDQPGVDRAKDQFPRLGPRPCAINIVEQPCQFGAGEIGIQQKAGLFGDQQLHPVSLEPLAGVRGAPILPDDGLVDRLARGAVPDEGRLALVGNANGGNLTGTVACLGQGRAAGGQNALPEVGGIVFDPARGRIVLGEFLLGGFEDFQVAVKKDGPTGCGALINRQNVSHVHVLPKRLCLS